MRNRFGKREFRNFVCPGKHLLTVWQRLMASGGLAINLLLVAAMPLSAYQWPLPTGQIVRGFLADRRNSGIPGEKPLPNLGFWFELDGSEPESSAVHPYHAGEIIYFETSSEMEILGPIPRNMDHTVMVQHDKLLFRYSSDRIAFQLQDSYQIDSNDVLFSADALPKSSRAEDDAAGRDGLLYMEVFDTQFQTVINPKLIMPTMSEGQRSSEPYLELVTRNITEEAPALSNRSLRRSDNLLRGIYNLNLRFPISQGPPLRLYVKMDGKNIYSEIFDQVYGINSKLLINDRDLQDIYISDTQEGRFFLGTINLQDKVNSSVRLVIDEEYIDGSHSIRNYNIRIR